MITHVHHINFIVDDLDEAVMRYQDLLSLDSFIFDSLDGRSVKTARAKLGETWLVLVQPTDEQGLPAQYLKKNGEGFFLMSLASDDLATQLEPIQQQYTLDEARQGLENWSVTDLPSNAFFGAQLQLTEEV